VGGPNDEEFHHEQSDSMVPRHPASGQVWLMASSLRRHAIVIGAGMGGLAAAAALADSFQHVTVLERDALRSDALPRPGAPQSNQVHGLLSGGQRALCALLPGFERDLIRAGAVRIRFGLDDRIEIPGCDPFPRRDLGCDGYTSTRPLLELTARRRVRQLPNVTLRDQCRVVEIVATDDGSVSGVRCRHIGRPEEMLPADLVVDASARGSLTMALLGATSWPEVERTEIGIDIRFISATFDIPAGRRDWKLVLTFPDGRTDTRAGFLLPVEGNRWMAAVGERHGAPPSPDEASFRQLVRELRTPTIHEAIRSARWLGRIDRFAFPESSRRHYERLDGFPRGLLPIGDAICRFNPIYGQGMTVAAQEARILRDLLRARAGQREPLAELGAAFIAAVQPVIEAAWSMSAVPDLAHPLTRGRRPPDLEESLQSAMALNRLAVRDPEIHKLLTLVRHLIEPMSALQAPDLIRRLELAAYGFLGR
jgi:2-polyprenyl-6-methoxyphenol hydroxylase-like FAD-dependent oxidoreductase